MTGDLGPGETRSEDLRSVLGPYVMTAAGLAAEREDETASRLLGQPESLEASFADPPVTSAEGHARAALDVILHAPPELARQATDDTRRRLADLLNEVVEPDGYHVRVVHVAAG